MTFLWAWFNWSALVSIGKIILEIIGGCTIIFGFIKGLSEISPKIKSFFWITLAQQYKHRKFAKEAIKSNIEEVVNDVVSELRQELPADWIKKASIQWVSGSSLEKMEKNKIILRMRPLENQDDNLLVGVYTFFNMALFPKSKEVLPSNIRRAAALQISRRAIEQKQPALRETFEDNYCEAAVQEDNAIARYLEEYNKMDKSGFFTGAFLREINEVATRARFRAIRAKIGDEIDGIIHHINLFLDELSAGGQQIPDYMWSRNGPVTSYAFLLVARPEVSGSEKYVARAKERLANGIERLYVFGKKEQKELTERVISDIQKIEGYELIETFSLNKDYRGNLNGVGALFITKKFKEELAVEKIPVENLPDKKLEVRETASTTSVQHQP